MFGVIFNRTSGEVARIINPDFEEQLDGHHVGEDEFMLRLSKAEHGISGAINAMTVEQVHAIVNKFRLD